jgi:hypothetical protein
MNDLLWLAGHKKIDPWAAGWTTLLKNMETIYLCPFIYTIFDSYPFEGITVSEKQKHKFFTHIWTHLYSSATTTNSVPA